MKIKIIAIATALFMIIPSMSAFASEDYDFNNGLLDIQENILPESNFPSAWYDNDLTTYGRTELFGNIIYFKQPVNINKMYLNFKNSYTRVYFYSDDELIYSINKSSVVINDYIDLNLKNVSSIKVQQNTESQGYLYEIDFFGEVTEPTPIEEVQEVNIQTKYNRVDLSWQLPQIEDFHHVVIYRKTIEELKDIETASLLDKIFGANKVYASEETEYDPLFETNGTYFNDLTVKPRSEYEYKLTTVTTDGKESKGVIVTAETPDEPNPQIVGGGYTETEDGDYLFQWTSPTEGQVKIIVGGKEYKTVNASDKQILIPKEDMVYAFAKPDVSLIPISPYGKEGNEFSSHPIKQIKIPFGANDLLKTGVSLLWVLGPFVLLAMAFLLVPKFRKTIVDAFNKKSENKRVSV